MMRARYFLLGAGFGSLCCGLLVLLYGESLQLEKWMLPFGATMIGMAFIKDFKV
jgi:hypothetical protein